MDWFKDYNIDQLNIWSVKCRLMSLELLAVCTGRQQLVWARAPRAEREPESWTEMLHGRQFQVHLPSLCAVVFWRRGWGSSGRRAPSVTLLENWSASFYSSWGRLRDVRVKFPSALTSIIRMAKWNIYFHNVKSKHTTNHERVDQIRQASWGRNHVLIYLGFRFTFLVTIVTVSGSGVVGLQWAG